MSRLATSRAKSHDRGPFTTVYEEIVWPGSEIDVTEHRHRARSRAQVAWPPDEETIPMWGGGDGPPNDDSVSSGERFEQRTLATDLSGRRRATLRAFSEVGTVVTAVFLGGDGG